jgi:hypothetical protein
MASAADRFTRLEKLAIFLIALGEERTREILADVDMDTLQHLNGAITSLGKVGAEEKAAVMLEFAHFFYADEPLASAGVPLVDTDVQTPPKTSSPGKNKRPRQTPGQVDLSGKTAKKISDEEQAILHTQDKLRHKVDPGKIDWGKAGYHFGEGFKVPDGGRQ